MNVWIASHERKLYALAVDFVVGSIAGSCDCALMTWSCSYHYLQYYSEVDDMKSNFVPIIHNRTIMIFRVVHTHRTFRPSLLEGHYDWPFTTYLTHWGRVTHILVGNLGHHWFRERLLVCSAPSHYLIQCCNIVIWTHGNKLQLNFNQNPYIFIQENAFENVI